jgi:apolipoprotein N-acyltransferase
LPATKDHVDNSRRWGKIGRCSTNVDIMFFAKVIIGILLGLIVLSLGASLFSVLKDKENSNRSVKLLTVRIALFIIPFVFIVISFYMGWLQPHGLAPPA